MSLQLSRWKQVEQNVLMPRLIVKPMALVIDEHYIISVNINYSIISLPWVMHSQPCFHLLHCKVDSSARIQTPYVNSNPCKFCGFCLVCAQSSTQTGICIWFVMRQNGLNGKFLLQHYSWCNVLTKGLQAAVDTNGHSSRCMLTTICSQWQKPCASCPLLAMLQQQANWAQLHLTEMAMSLKQVIVFQWQCSSSTQHSELLQQCTNIPAPNMCTQYVSWACMTTSATERLETCVTWDVALGGLI